jgi:RNA polymerase sigma-70 factor (ECF subfamily)
VTSSIEEIVRVEGGQVLATLIRLTRSFDLAEDALQDATVVALTKWADAGIPVNPGAWLTTVARNKALDRMRREKARALKETEAAMLLDDVVSERSDLLRLMFTCCHPALSEEARVALTLRTLGGLSTAEIAQAFLVPEPTMGQRISRAKKKIAKARVPYRVPEDHELPDRLPAVLAVLYLVFTTGHHAPEGHLDSRVELAVEAIRLTRMLAALMPDENEVNGLLALMMATHARAAARIDGQGVPVLMADQDRTKWDRAAIAEASRLVDRTLRRRNVGPFQIQAAISCLHGQAASDEETDWSQIGTLYGMLERMQPTAVVRVNRAVAVGKTEGPLAGLDLLSGIRGVDDWHLYWATQAELLRQLGRRSEAATALRTALGCTMNDSDRALLERRLAEMRADL